MGSSDAGPPLCRRYGLCSTRNARNEPSSRLVATAAAGPSSARALRRSSPAHAWNVYLPLDSPGRGFPDRTKSGRICPSPIAPYPAPAYYATHLHKESRGRSPAISRACTRWRAVRERDPNPCIGRKAAGFSGPDVAGPSSARAACDPIAPRRYTVDSCPRQSRRCRSREPPSPSRSAPTDRPGST